jgi:hypothetical protein
MIAPAFHEVLSLEVFGLFANIEATDGAEISHHTGIHLAALPLFVF